MRMRSVRKTGTLMGGALLFAAVLLTPSCATMHVTDEWRDKTFPGPPYRRIMVVALTKRVDLRQPMEDEFSRQIKAWGGEAVACHVCIPDIDRVSREALAEVGAGMGIEAYLVVRVLQTDARIESYRSSIPPAVGDYGTDSMVNMDLLGSPDPPIQKKTESMTLESRLYDGKSAKLIWRSTVESVSPFGREGEIPRFVRTVLAALGGDGLIPGR